MRDATEVFPLDRESVFLLVPNDLAHGKQIIVGGATKAEVFKALALRDISRNPCVEITAKAARALWNQGYSAALASAMIHCVRRNATHPGGSLWKVKNAK